MFRSVSRDSAAEVVAEKTNVPATSRRLRKVARRQRGLKNSKVKPHDNHN